MTSTDSWASSPPVYSLYINNKHGSLVYQKDICPSANLTVNDRIRLASTFHGLCAIVQQVAPITPSITPQSGSAAGGVNPNELALLQPRGISAIEADAFRLHCLETPTGLRFFLVVHPTHNGTKLTEYLTKVYEAYSDFVLKNPFYDADMPIRCALFDKQVDNLFGRYAARHTVPQASPHTAPSSSATRSNTQTQAYTHTQSSATSGTGTRVSSTTASSPAAGGGSTGMAARGGRESPG